jgi:hypothetical protein
MYAGPAKSSQIELRIGEIKAGCVSNQIAGWSSLVARQAHNLKAVGSNPTPATTFKPCQMAGLFLYKYLYIGYLPKGMLLSETLSVGIFAFGSDRTTRNYSRVFRSISRQKNCQKRENILRAGRLAPRPLTESSAPIDKF